MSTFFKDKVCLITGGSSGIGLALALELGARGCKVAISGRDSSRLEEAQKLIQSRGIDVESIQGDVAIEHDCKAMVEQTVKRFNQIDILINNAGMSMRALFQDVDIEVMRQLMEVNFWGTVYCTKYALPYIMKNKGSIVGVSSIAGHRGLPARIGYSSSKFAMQGFMESLRTEHLKSGVHVLMVNPNFTASNIRNTALSSDGSVQEENPLDEKKLMPAETVDSMTADAIEKKKRDLIITTQGKLTVLLNRLLPSFMDKMVYKHFEKEGNLKS